MSHVAEIEAPLLTRPALAELRYTFEAPASLWTQRSFCHSSNPSAPVFALMRQAIIIASASFSQATPWISNTLKVLSKKRHR